jgi:DNA-binding NarL/FixJ family response regulator
MGIAVLTLHAEQGYRQKCLALGADWFFDKTRECEDLLAVVRQYAELH